MRCEDFRDFCEKCSKPSGKGSSATATRSIQHDMRSLVESLNDRGAEFVAISDDSFILEEASAKFQMPARCPDELSPILYAVPIQLFAENLARLKGLNPDNPRSLCKVTETW